MNTRVNLVCAMVLVSVAGCTGIKLDRPLNPEKTDWTVFAGNNQRSNISEQVVIPPLTVAWVHDITGGIGNGSPLVIDSTVIVGNLRGELYAINARTGKRYGWIDLGEAIQGSPAVDSNIAYVASANAEASLVAYDMYHAKILWKRNYGDIEVSPLYADGRLFFGTTWGTFFCVGAAEGNTLWQFELPDNTRRKGIRSTAAVADSVVVFGAEDAYVYGLNHRNGAILWTAKASAPVDAPPAIGGTTVYVGDLGGMVYALDIASGAVLWSVNVGTAVYACATVTPGMIVIGTTGGALVALRPGDGRKLWVTDLDAVINSSAVLSGQVLYVGTLKKMFFAVNATDGTIVWSMEMGGRVKTSPAVADGKVFVAVDDKSVVAFRGGGR